jgi:hypothetical protein
LTGSFVDTTVLSGIAESTSSRHAACVKAVETYRPAQLAQYALKEFFLSRVWAVCIAHNALRAANDPGEAILSIGIAYWAKPRIKQGAIDVLAHLISTLWAAELSSEQRKTEMLDAMALQAIEMWQEAQSHPALTHVQPLACYLADKLTLDDVGALVPGRRTFGCLHSQRCAAAGYLFERQLEIEKLRKAMRPKKGEPHGREASGWRRALKDLEVHGPKEFSKRRCRSIGDTYFAVMCPPAVSVLTTNTKDHEPLCAALGKEMVTP